MKQPLIAPINKRAEMPTASPEISDTKAMARSRVTNGSAMLPGVDGRSTWVRRLRDLQALHIADLGGDQNVSEAERSIVRRAATLTVELERMEAGFATAGEAKPTELAVYTTTTNALRRLLTDLGLDRRARNVTPSIAEYSARKAAEKARAA
jgi:hypothetical protein